MRPGTPPSLDAVTRKSVCSPLWPLLSYLMHSALHPGAQVASVYLDDFLAGLGVACHHLVLQTGLGVDLEGKDRGPVQGPLILSGSSCLLRLTSCPLWEVCGRSSQHY